MRSLKRLSKGEGRVVAARHNNTLGMQRWDEITGAVTGEAFDYLPNF